MLSMRCWTYCGSVVSKNGLVIQYLLIGEPPGIGLSTPMGLKMKWYQSRASSKRWFLLNELAISRGAWKNSSQL